MSDIQGAKAISLVARGGVREIEHVRVFDVDGSSGTPYRVTVTADGATCTCEAGRHGRQCYHVRAVRLVMLKQRG